MDNTCRAHSGRAFFPDIIFLLASSSILSGVLISARFGWRKGLFVVFCILTGIVKFTAAGLFLLLCYQERRGMRTSPTADANARSCGSPTIHIISVYLIVWSALNQDARPCSRLANQRGEYHAFEGNIHSDSVSHCFKNHCGAVVYCPEDDVHFPIPTVERTIKFAAKLRTLHHRL